MPEIGIGSPVWVYDENSRVYRRDEKGHAYGSPIERHYWRPDRIVGENRVSWLLAYQGKMPKKNPDPRKFQFSEEDVNRASWIEDNRHGISDAVRECKDYATLKSVATIVSYVEREDTPNA